MERRSVLLAACLLWCVPVWATAQPSSSASRGGEGELYVYLQPLSLDAERTSFSLAEVAAVDGQGTPVPLKLSFTTVRGSDARRQQLLATARIPEGSYAGLSLRVQKASTRREGRDAALLVADAATRVDAPFVLARAKAVVLWLTAGAQQTGASDVSFSPAWSAVVAPRPITARAVFVSNTRSNSITVVDKRVRQAAAVIPTAAGPAGLALDRRRERLYVACSRADEVQAVDVLSGEVVEHAKLSPGDGPRELALTPDGRQLLSVNSGSDSVTIFDLSPLSRQDRIEVGSGPGSLVIDPAGRRAYVFNTLGSTITVIDLARRAVVATVATESSPLRGQFTVRGDKLYVVHERSPYLTVIDADQLSLLTRARLRMAGGAINVDDRRGIIYVGGRDEPAVEFYDPGTLLPVDAIRTKAGVSCLAIDAEDNTIYIVQPDAKRLAIGSLADRKVVADIDVGDGPYWVVAMGER
jgi:YVTN family beta-propeller protein